MVNLDDPRRYQWEQAFESYHVSFVAPDHEREVLLASVGSVIDVLAYVRKQLHVSDTVYTKAKLYGVSRDHEGRPGLTELGAISQEDFPIAGG